MKTSFFCVLFLSTPFITLGEVHNCYSCTPHVADGQRCDNPYQFSSQPCKITENYACITIQTDDGGWRRGCTEKQHCEMFPMFEEGECCFSDFCNTELDFPSTRSFQLVAFIQFGLPLINLIFTIIGVILTILMDRRDKRRQSMRQAASEVEQNGDNDYIIYVRPQTPMLQNGRNSAASPARISRANRADRVSSVSSVGGKAPADRVRESLRASPKNPHRQPSPSPAPAPHPHHHHHHRHHHHKNRPISRNIGSSGSSTPSSARSLLVCESSDNASCLNYQQSQEPIQRDETFTRHESIV